MTGTSRFQPATPAGEPAEERWVISLHWIDTAPDGRTVAMSSRPRTALSRADADSIVDRLWNTTTLPAGARDVVLVVEHRHPDDGTTLTTRRPPAVTTTRPRKDTD